MNSSYKRQVYTIKLMANAYYTMTVITEVNISNKQQVSNYEINAFSKLVCAMKRTLHVNIDGNNEFFEEHKKQLCINVNV